MSAGWDEQAAADALAAWGPAGGADLALLVYASRRLGEDPSLVLHGGGNTSLKTVGADPAGRRIDQLLVKASGRDLARIEPADFVALDLARLREFLSAPEIGDDRLAAVLASAAIRPDGARPSVETLLHAAVFAPFVLHTHAEPALIEGAQPGGAARVSGALAAAGLDGRVAAIPYARSGWALARAAMDALSCQPGLEGLVVRRHGVFAWGNSAREAFECMLAIVAAFRRGTPAPSTPPPRRADLPARSADERRRAAARIAPLLRGALTRPSDDPDQPRRRVVLAYRGSDALAAAVDAEGAADLASRGPLTPDHAIWVRTCPLVVEAAGDEPPDALRERLAGAVAAFEQRYGEDVRQHLGAKAPDVGDFKPRVVLVPGAGLFAAGAGPRDARVAADIAERTVLAQRAAEALGRFEPLARRDLLDIEFWAAERAKLHPGGQGSLAGRAALVTGGAGAIGAAVGAALAAAGAKVFLADGPGAEQLPRLERAVARVVAAAGDENAAMAIPFDVTDAAAVERAFESIAVEAGGADLLVLSHGAALVGEIADLDPRQVEDIFAVNAQGCFNVLGSFTRQLKAQGGGGDVVLISTKNVPDPGASFAAYSASKAAAHQLCRVAALELAPLDVRVNMVSPDAVFGDEDVPSVLWKTVGQARARAKGIDPATLPEQYRQRNLLKARVTARHVAEAVLFFVERRTPTTGAVLPVDGGLPGAFPR